MKINNSQICASTLFHICIKTLIVQSIPECVNSFSEQYHLPYILVLLIALIHMNFLRENSYTPLLESSPISIGFKISELSQISSVVLCVCVSFTKGNKV